MTPIAEALIALPPRCGLAGLDELRAALIDGLDRGALAIDAAALQRIDAPALQLLCAAVRTAARRGVAFRWQAPPASLVATATALGLVEALGLPAGMGA